MNINHVIRVDGDPVWAVRRFLANWWRRADLTALLVPVEVPGRAAVAVQAIEHPAQLDLANPFAPVMVNNTAALLGEFAQKYRGQRAAAVLRPCELRTLARLREQQRLPAEVDAVTIIAIDCPGTYAVDEYHRRVEASGTAAVAREALQYAAQGGFSPTHMRAACQVCDWPAPRGAELAIGAIGVNPDEYLLAIARDEQADMRLGLEAVTAGRATEAQAARRETAVGAVAEHRAHTREHVFGGAANGRPGFSELGTLLAWFAGCSLCGDCLDACPLYNGELSGMLGVHGARPPLAELINISRWLASCSGCGMCEASCAQDVPLMLLVSALSHAVQSNLPRSGHRPAEVKVAG